MAVTDVERGLIARYAQRVLSSPDGLPLRATRHVLYWLNDRAETFSLPLPKQLAKAIGNIYSGNFSAAEFERAYRNHREEYLATLSKAADETSRPEPLASNVEKLVQELGLDEAAWKVIGLIACYTRYDQVQYFCDSVTESSGPMARCISMLVREPMRSIETLISPAGPLAASGLLQHRDGDEISGPGGRFAIAHRVDACLDRTFENYREMRGNLLGKPLAAEIEIDDYQHVSADRDMAIRLLSGAAKSGAPGVNILLHGPPGTGKTELSKVAAEAAGLALYGAGEEVAREGEADRSARLADLVFSIRLLAGAKNSALLFDEMEDVAWQLMRRGGSKIYLNRLLETNSVPVIWTSNNIHEIDPALVRRMSLAIELKLPPQQQRRRILERMSKRLGLTLEGTEIEDISRRVEAPPAVLYNAVKAAILTGGGASDVERAALGVMRAVKGYAVPMPAALPNFDPRLVEANMDLADLTKRLAESGNRAFSICLSGPPGTGKSAFARSLAQALGLEVVQKRASDLLSMWVGESEKQIAAAFEEARESGSFLIFDEADSLLLDRKDAVRSWEVTQVNEMLTWMEDHAYPVCFTTNLMDRLDEASLRRFTFDVRFGYLSRRKLKLAYKLLLNLAEVPEAGLALANLTPGDFAQAAKRVAVLKLEDKVEEIVKIMEAISRAKRGASGRIGFVS